MHNTDPTSAYIGIAGAIGMAISDVMLLGISAAGWEGDIASFNSLSQVSVWRIQVATLIGWVSSFFICFGFWYLREKMKHLDEKLATIMFISLSSMMVFGGAYHAGNNFAGMAIHTGNMELYQAFISYLQIMSYISVPGLVAGTGIYFYLLSAKANGFPRWLRYANLIVLMGSLLGFFSLLPAPIGGYIKPTFINIAFIIFFTLNLTVKEN